jgi:hypothetical protein
MHSEFFHEKTRAEAYGRLAQIMNSGTVKLMGAVCYVTAEGCKLLESNVGRFKNPGSYFIAGYNETSDIREINKLCSLAPGKFFFHGICGSGTESKEGTMMPGLMHDKLIYAQNSEGATVWVGSHNLTKNALRGVNIEAAAIVTGHPDEPFFQEVRKHLEAIRQESFLGPAPIPLPPPIADPIRELVLVHCEADEKTIEAMGATHQGFVSIHLRQDGYDKLCIPPANPEKHVRLFLYAPGELSHAGPIGQARLVKSGEIYGVNFTEKSTRRGNKADWPAMDFTIEDPPGAPFQPLRMCAADRDPSADVTVCAIRIDQSLTSLNEGENCCILSRPPASKLSYEKTKVDLSPEAGSRRRRHIQVIQGLKTVVTISQDDQRASGAKLGPLYAARGEALTTEIDDTPFRFIHNGKLFPINRQDSNTQS